MCVCVCVCVCVCARAYVRTHARTPVCWERYSKKIRQGGEGFYTRSGATASAWWVLIRLPSKSGDWQFINKLWEPLLVNGGAY